MGTVGGGMTAVLSMLNDQLGIDLARMMRAKTDAAVVEAEEVVTTARAKDVPTT